MTKQKCSAKTYRDWHFYPCSRKATVEREGKWYCWQHDPERAIKQNQKRQAQCDAEANERKAKETRRNVERDVCAGVSTDTLDKLGYEGLLRLLKSLGED